MTLLDELENMQGQMVLSRDKDLRLRAAAEIRRLQDMYIGLQFRAPPMANTTRFFIVREPENTDQSNMFERL